MEAESSSKKRAINHGHVFTDLVLSWSIKDIFNEELYRHQVEEIGLSFESIEHYFGSYKYPLLEETRAQLCSSMEILFDAPFAEVISLEEAGPYGAKLYDVKIDSWKNRFSDRGKEPYKTLPGDVFVLSDGKPETVDDLQRVGKWWTFLSVAKIPEGVNEDDDTISIDFKVKASKDIDIDEASQKCLFVVFLTNIIPNRRIWSALHMNGNLRIIKETLCTGDVVEETCDHCPAGICGTWDMKLYQQLSSELNESQSKAILACLSALNWSHRSTVDLIWGPPGTGKTKILSTLLYTLMGMKCRILTCAPTNVAIKEVVSRLLSMVRGSYGKNSDAPVCSLGDMLIFGNHERLKIGSDIEEIYLDYRVEQLTNCFASSTGWMSSLTSMIDLLDNGVSSYHIFIENERMKEKENLDENKTEQKGTNHSGHSKMPKSFVEYIRERFVATASPLRNCIDILCKHVSLRYILEENFNNMVCLTEMLDSFHDLLFENDLLHEALEELFSLSEVLEKSSKLFTDVAYELYKKRNECLSLLKSLKSSLCKLNLPTSSIAEFCFQTSSLIFSTALSSFKLHFMDMEPLNFLVIDEAAQLKECESIIPFLLPGINHAILVGDECQLPAMVESNVSSEAGFGRSLFERLSLLGHSKHLLDVQYRMHPSISFFPNSYFYFNQIRDAQNVKRKNYEKKYLPWPMFGSFSFINVRGGREEFDDAGRSRRNMVEVAIVVKLVKNLYKVWIGLKENLSIGIVSPYAAQVVAIQEKLDQKYENVDGFHVNVKSIGGFQGGEQDIVILSTVRTNSSSSLKFVSSPQRTNVALTRARHCLWILGNERTLTSQENVWKSLVLNAKNRRCFFNADEDRDLAKAILDVKKDLDQFDDLLNADSVLFRNARWKVLFSNYFLKSFKNLRSVRTKKSVISLFLKLASGWRPKRSGNSSNILKQFKVEGLFVVCSTDIVKESRYTQILKIWDILPPEDVPKLVKRLDSIFGRYTDDFISRCNEKCFEGKMEVPMTWANSVDIIRYKNPDNNGTEHELSVNASDGRSYVENSKVGESLLLMKFYSLSSTVVNHLLSDRDGLELDLPFEVTDEEREIILFPRSTFILGRSGTGKTTVLTMKLFQRENLHRIAVEAYYGTKNVAGPCLIKDKESKEGTIETDIPVLRQLFVTVSPKLCQAVKHHVTRLTRSICSDDISAESSSIAEEIDDIAFKFKNIPDSFIDLPPNSYPLVVTFNKFLMMLDGTLGDSFFEKFQEIRNPTFDQSHGLKSAAFENFIRRKEVNYDRFTSSYWPHFNSQLTKNLDSSRVFIEVISHIKGGIQAAESGDGGLSQVDYVNLSEKRTSSLSRQKREMIYEIFQNYERMKMDNGEFDLADLVIDIHRRVRNKRYKGDEIDFVYIDEVQDLTMRQIALFRYICSNVEEGFVFSGDTAQTIARGIDFRFQDIRSLFYRKFVLESKSNIQNERKEKGQISDIFVLSQNFRTHAGVLKLSQSIIELIYRFFPNSIDALKPETSLIYGEAPVVLESGNGDNAIVTIFGNSGNLGGKIVGFGAEQVILVRDDSGRKEISDCVGKQALVLTVLECKGLEFQDVLLYNFFGSSPLKNRWRVIYQYMMEQGLLDSTSLRSHQYFSDSKHNVLCSELKQLYVAVTRTRQRLWICENTDEFSIPMFDYWVKKCLVQVKHLDDSLAQAMKVASSPEEWKERGIKLYNQNNFELATMCFERAGDSYWERKSKAAGLKSNANRLRDLNPEDASATLREAAAIFEGIGMNDSAAECFFDLRDFERAGKLYLERRGEPDFKSAGDCFRLATCYEIAAQVFARGNHFSECLTVCAEGKLFDTGLDYIEHWKQKEAACNGVVKEGDERNRIEQKFLESCALHYHELNETRLMMKAVKAFHSMDMRRRFLNSLGLLEELLLLEEEMGNFQEAASIAKKIGDILLMADLLGKAGNFSEASALILFYVLVNSLWSFGSKGWPLKQFAQKEELLRKAKLLAKNDTDDLYELVCTEAGILSDEPNNIFNIMAHLNSSRRYKSDTCEVLCLRKLLDAHFECNSSMYVWHDDLIVDSSEHIEGMILKYQLSLETLFYSWNCWKDRILQILDYLPCLKTRDINKYSCEQFVLNYFGVWRQSSDRNDIFLLLIPDADWVLKMGNRILNKNGKLVAVDVHLLVSAAQTYWSSELLAVGTSVLHNLEALYKLSVEKNYSIFCQSRSLTLIHSVSKFLLHSKIFSHSHSNLKTLEKFFRLPISHFFGCLVPLDWRKSSTKNMASLRGTKACQDLVKEIIYDSLKRRDGLTYGQIGRIAVMILGMGRPENDLCMEIVRRFDDNQPWKDFIEGFLVSGVKIPLGSALLWEKDLIFKFCTALNDTYNANWFYHLDYISPICFIYLIERLLILTSSWKGSIFATKSSFVEWLIYQDGNALQIFSSLGYIRPNLNDVHKFIERVLVQLLYNQNDTIEWIRKTEKNWREYHAFVVLRLFMSLSLLFLSTGMCLVQLCDLLGKSHITDQLPSKFFDVLRKRKRNLDAKVFAEAFRKVDNPLLIVKLWGKNSKISCPDAVFVDLTTIKHREDAFQVLFPDKVKAIHEETSEVKELAEPPNRSNIPNTISTSVADQVLNTAIDKEANLQINTCCFWDMLDYLQLAIDEEPHQRFLPISQKIKISVDEVINLCTESLAGAIPFEDKNQEMEVMGMLDELKQLSAALSMSEPSLFYELCKRILARRLKAKDIYDQLFLCPKKIVAADSGAFLPSLASCISEASKGDMSKGSEAVVKSGGGDGKKSKKNKQKKNKGGRKAGR